MTQEFLDASWALSKIQRKSWVGGKCGLNVNLGISADVNSHLGACTLGYTDQGDRFPDLQRPHAGLLSQSGDTQDPCPFPPQRCPLAPHLSYSGKQGRRKAAGERGDPSHMKPSRSGEVLGGSASRDVGSGARSWCRLQPKAALLLGDSPVGVKRRECE